jgi:hypothetical protein
VVASTTGLVEVIGLGQIRLKAEGMDRNERQTMLVWRCSLKPAVSDKLGKVDADSSAERLVMMRRD